MVIIEHERCDLCGTCVSVCPADCIELTETKLIIDNSKCTSCGTCVPTCPFEALKLVD